MAILKPNREKYLKIYREKGLTVALTDLHKEMWELEFQTFEGREGYQPDLYESLRLYREFSRELWNHELHDGTPPAHFQN